MPVRKDLIYEGITTLSLSLLLQLSRQKGPDLRRDYDRYYRIAKIGNLQCQKGPDLRRDYDGCNPD